METDVYSPCRAHTDGMVKYVDSASPSNFFQQRLNLGIIPSLNLLQTQVTEQYTQNTSNNVAECCIAT